MCMWMVVVKDVGVCGWWWSRMSAYVGGGGQGWVKYSKTVFQIHNKNTQNNLLLKKHFK